ncbi:hypothetical protein RJT34_30382 [Clitoria ternatea]|uniref:Uncharacterized protein n=1 Tax=Clitoria ternatea TaxID=43366 RepID=A0AAN9EUG6_CLITE
MEDLFRLKVIDGGREVFFGRIRFKEALADELFMLEGRLLSGILDLNLKALVVARDGLVNLIDHGEGVKATSGETLGTRIARSRTGMVRRMREGGKTSGRGRSPMDRLLLVGLRPPGRTPHSL